MDDALTRRLGVWFGAIEVEDELPGPVVACLSQLVEMLDAVAPTKVDRSRSTIRSEGHGWALSHGVEIRLAHDADCDGDVEVGIGEKEGIVSWLSAHEHVDPGDGDDERPWSTVVVDVVAAALRGEYEVENHWRGSRLQKTRIVDVAVPEERRVVSTTGSLLGWLPWGGAKRVEVQRLDYGVSGTSSRRPDSA